jgi:hypothetical protein
MRPELNILLSRPAIQVMWCRTVVLWINGAFDRSCRAMHLAC